MFKMRRMYQSLNVSAVLCLLLPFVLSMWTVISAYAAEEEQVVLDEAGKARIALAYQEVGDELHWQVTLNKAASDEDRQLTLKLQLDDSDLSEVDVTSRNAHIENGWLTYTQTASAQQTQEEVTFTTPNNRPSYEYVFVPELQQGEAAGQQQAVPLAKEEYRVTTEVPQQGDISQASEVEATTTTEETAVGTTEAEGNDSVQSTEETDVQTPSDTSSAVPSDAVGESQRSATGIANPLAGLIGQGLLERAIPATYSFNYANDSGSYLVNGHEDGNTYNYAYGQTNEVPFDDEGYVNYDDAAYVKKSVAENPAKQGLFDVTLDVKGNQTENPIDLVLLIDFSSYMTGAKLQNAIQGVSDFLDEIKDSLGEEQVKIGIVAYNRYVYSTGGFLTDANQLISFMSNTAESHTGTFIQKGLYEAESLFNNYGRSNAHKMLVHIGDGSANRAYLEQEGAPVYQNNGEIRAVNGYSAATYVTEFQTESPKFYNTSESSDANSILLDKTQVANLTLGKAVTLKTQGIEMYSVGVNPSSRGEYVAQNLAVNASHYKSIDEDLVGLGEALGTVASQIDKTISNGTISDPMGDHILLQTQSGSFGAEDYQLQGWRKTDSGSWAEAPDLVTGVTVSEAGGTLQLQGLTLGRDERITLTYQVRINTEAADFQADSWYLANGRTTLDLTSSGNLVDFPIPSVKAPGTMVRVTKAWEDNDSPQRPEEVQVTVNRAVTTASDSWQESEPITIAAAEGWTKEITEVTPKGTTTTSQLPLYNNQGEDFTYSLKEILTDDRYTSSVTTAGDNEVVITNTLRTIDLAFTKRRLDNEPLAGAVFELHDDQGNLLATATSDADGVVRFADLTPGFYTLKEIQAPAGFVSLDREIPLEVRVDAAGQLQIFIDYGDGFVEWSDPNVYNLPDDPEPVSKADFEFTKLGETSDGSVPLPNVTFKLTSLFDRGKIITVTSDENGTVAFTDLDEGVYVLEEVSAPTGYDPIDPVIIRVYRTEINTLAVAYPDGVFDKDGNTLQLLNKGSLDLELQKVTDNDQPLAGAVFELQDAQGNRLEGPVVSDEQGKLVFTHVTQGTYYLVEVDTPDGYVGSEKIELTIDYDDNGQLAVLQPENWNKKIVNKKLTDFTFNKQDEDGAPLRGAVFELQDQQGNTVYGPVVSDRDGQVTFTDVVQGTYQLVETSGPDNYYLADPIEVTIGYNDENQLTVLEPSDWADVVVNKAKRSDFTFTKTNAQGQPLSGAVFELRDEQGALVQGPITSGADGRVTFEGIAVGTYYLVETQAPEGYQMIDPVKVVVDLDDDGTPTIVQPANWTNQYQVKNELLTTDFRFTKADYLGDPLAGATFELRDQQGNVVQGPVTAGQDGQVLFTGLTIGEYQLVETQAPAGYLPRDPIPVSVYVDDDGQLIATPDLGDYDDLWDGKIYNMPDVEEPEPNAEFPFIKMGETAFGNSPLPGVTFELTSLYGGASYQAVSDENGKVNFTGVAAGFYALREIDYPDGYVPSDPIPVRVYWDEHGFLHVDYPEEEFEVDENGLPILVNHQGTGLQLTKTDELGQPLAGAVFELRDANGTVIGEPQTSDENGRLMFSNLTAGTYQLVETQAPEGFIPGDPIEITVAYDDQGQLVVTKPDGWDSTIVNQQAIDVPITKVSETGEVLSGAQFVLRDADGQFVQGPVITDYQGQALFTGLTKGTYYLVETQAPDGYDQLTDPIQIVIDYDDTGRLAVTSPIGWTGDVVNKKTETTVPPPDSSEEPEEPGSSDSSGNSGGSGSTGGSTSGSGKKPGGSLLQTGDTVSLVYVLFGMMLLALSGRLFFKSKR